MPAPHDRFEPLARMARHAQDPASAAYEMPPALATRVLAQLRENVPAAASLWESWSLRAVPVAAAIAAMCVFFGDGIWPGRSADERKLAEALVEQQLP